MLANFSVVYELNDIPLKITQVRGRILFDFMVYGTNKTLHQLPSLLAVSKHFVSFKQFFENFRFQLKQKSTSSFSHDFRTSRYGLMDSLLFAVSSIWYAMCSLV